MTDIVDDILQRVSDIDQSFTPEKYRQVESIIRNQYGGSRVYVRQSCAVNQDRVIRDYLNGSVDQTIKKHGISRATLYRLIKR